MTDFNNNKELFKAICFGCTLNNNARIDLKDGDFVRVGEPTEAAMLVLAEKICGNPVDNQSAFKLGKETAAKHPVIAQMDFTSERKAMSTIVSGYKNSSDILLKGAPDRILKKCTGYYMLNGQHAPVPMTDS